MLLFNKFFSKVLSKSYKDIAVFISKVYSTSNNDKLLKKLATVTSIFDFAPGEYRYLKREMSDIIGEYEKPEYHTFYLCGNKLVDLDTYKDHLLNLFFQSYDPYSYGEKRFVGIKDSVDGWLVKVTNGQYNSQNHFTMMKKSIYGKDYFSKIDIPNNFADILHNKVLEDRNDNIFLFTFLSYLSSSYFSDFDDCSSLLGESRKGFLNHELSTFIKYKEQAIYLSNYLLAEMYGFDFSTLPEFDFPSDFTEFDFASDITLHWKRNLAIGLRKYADKLPSLPSGINFYLDDFGYAEKKKEDTNFLDKCVWLSFFSFLAFELLSLFLFSFGRYIGLPCGVLFCYAIIKYFEDISFEKIQKTFKTFKRTFKQNKIKVSCIFLLNIFSPILARILGVGQALLKTCTIILSNSTEIQESSRLVFQTFKSVFILRGTLQSQTYRTNKLDLSYSSHSLKKENISFYIKQYKGISSKVLKTLLHTPDQLSELHWRQSHVISAAYEGDLKEYIFYRKMLKDTDQGAITPSMIT